MSQRRPLVAREAEATDWRRGEGERSVKIPHRVLLLGYQRMVAGD
jgi:hypothetical protein